MIFTAQFFWFAISGIAGFIVDTVILMLLKDPLGLYLARLCSFFCAVFVTWLINRTFTFGDYHSNHSRVKEFLIYLSLMLAGGSVNYLLYALLVYTYSVVAIYPVIAVAAGSVAGMLINLLTSKFVLFRFKKNKPT